MKHLNARFAIVVAAMCLAMLAAAPAQAQATRTWVSGVGDDANPCSRTAPCKTFAGAISKTAPSGEIDCLDPGGFGAVTITKAITIFCDSVSNGGVVVSGTNGIAVAAGANDVVTLSGLDIDGAALTGLNGISVTSGNTLIVRNCNIRNFGHAGILISPTAANTFQAYIASTLLENNLGGGIMITNAAGQILTAMIDQTEMVNNNFGVFAQGNSAAGGQIQMAIRDTVVTNNPDQGIVASTHSGGPGISMVVDRVISSNSTAGFGILADGPSTGIVIGRSTIERNLFGVGTSNGASLVSVGNNIIFFNATNGTPVTQTPLN